MFELLICLYYNKKMPKIIYSSHAQVRMKKRRLSPISIEDTILHPDHHCPTKSGQQKFIKQQGSRLYHVVATYLSEQKAYLVISAWVRGEEDRPPLLWRLLTLPFALIAKIFLLDRKSVV